MVCYPRMSAAQPNTLVPRDGFSFLSPEIPLPKLPFPMAPSLAADGFGADLSASAIVGGTVTGCHLLHIDGYSQIKEELPKGQCIKSCPFTAGGCSWYINYYPNGIDSSSTEFISIYLNLHQRSDKPVKARARFALLDQAGKQVTAHTRTTELRKFSSGGYGFGDFIKRDLLEESEYLKDDRFTIRCDVIVYLELRAEERKRPVPAFVVVPPSDLHRHFGDLLAHKEGADVTFHVAGETFKAHRCVLAARSPVFKAQLFGEMKESKKEVVINVDGMDAEVFRALLCFVYTDALPDCPDVKKQEDAAMAQHLLVAADRYNLERLKLICEDILCGHIDTASAATILVLAEQHRCHGLKEACFQFLGTPLTFSAVMATDGFDHLTRSCPSLLKELMSNIAARMS